MMCNKQTLKVLKDYGYLWCPKVVEKFGQLTDEELGKLGPKHPLVTLALQEYQRVFSRDLDNGSLHFHNRVSVADGVEGPATRYMMQVHDRDDEDPERAVHIDPRCGSPDFFRADDRMEANHPESCRNNLTQSWDLRLNGLTGGQIMEGFTSGAKVWTDRWECMIKMVPEQYPNTSRYIDGGALGGSVLAWQYLAVSRCGVNLQGRFNTGRGWDLQYFTTVDAHEIGHFWGHPHITNDNKATMYPSIHQYSLERWGAPNESDAAQMDALGYKRRTAPPVPEPPDDDIPSWGKELINQMILLNSRVDILNKRIDNIR